MEPAQYNNRSKSISLWTDFQQKNPILTTFLARLLLCYLVWKIGFSIIWRFPELSEAYRAFALFIINGILYSTAFVLEVLGYPIEIEWSSRLVKIVGTVGVTIGEPCIGLGVMALFCALIVAYPKHFYKKLWFLPLGLLLIYSLNILRISLLAIMVKFDPALWELNHKFIFKIVIYIVVLLLWDRWMKLAKKEA